MRCRTGILPVAAPPTVRPSPSFYIAASGRDHRREDAQGPREERLPVGRGKGHASFPRGDGQAPPPRLAPGPDHRTHRLRLLGDLATPGHAPALALLLVGARGGGSLLQARAGAPALQTATRRGAGRRGHEPCLSRSRQGAQVHRHGQGLAVPLPPLQEVLRGPRDTPALWRGGQAWQHRRGRALHPLVQGGVCPRTASGAHGVRRHAGRTGLVRQVVRRAPAARGAGGEDAGRGLSPARPGPRQAAPRAAGQVAAGKPLRGAAGEDPRPLRRPPPSRTRPLRRPLP
jgi:hypothetical protein